MKNVFFFLLHSYVCLNIFYRKKGLEHLARLNSDAATPGGQGQDAIRSHDPIRFWFIQVIIYLRGILWWRFFNFDNNFVPKQPTLVILHWAWAETFWSAWLAWDERSFCTTVQKLSAFVWEGQYLCIFCFFYYGFCPFSSLLLPDFNDYEIQFKLCTIIREGI